MNDDITTIITVGAIETGMLRLCCNSQLNMPNNGMGYQSIVPRGLSEGIGFAAKAASPKV